MDEHGATADLRDEQYQELLFSDPRANPEGRRHVADTIGAFVQSRPAEEVYRRSQSLHFAWGIVRRPEENLDDPHWEDRGFFWEGELSGVEEDRAVSGGSVSVYAVAGSVAASAASGRGSTTMRCTWGELGLTPADLRGLLESGVV